MGAKNVFMISNEGVGDAVRDGLRGANHSNSLAIARICNDADRPKPRPHTHEEIVNTFLGAQGVGQGIQALLQLCDLGLQHRHAFVHVRPSGRCCAVVGRRRC